MLWPFSKCLGKEGEAVVDGNQNNFDLKEAKIGGGEDMTLGDLPIGLAYLKIEYFQNAARIKALVPS